MDSWSTLKSFTRARIAQGSAGAGWPTNALLDFQLAHAEARDAVLKEWDIQAFRENATRIPGGIEILESCACDRPSYLQRPDFGRRLNAASSEKLRHMPLQRPDVALILSNGLSTTAVDHHALPILDWLTRRLRQMQLQISPLYIVANGRVALSDEIGELTGARSTVILIGERPGLSAADSLGAYLTIFPRIGRNDAERNCISNIREPDGLSYRIAAGKIAYLLMKGFQLGYGGVGLKDDSPSEPELLEASLEKPESITFGAIHE